MLYIICCWKVEFHVFTVKGASPQGALPLFSWDKHVIYLISYARAFEDPLLGITGWNGCSYSYILWGLINKVHTSFLCVISFQRSGYKSTAFKKIFSIRIEYVITILIGYGWIKSMKASLRCKQYPSSKSLQKWWQYHKRYIDEDLMKKCSTPCMET